jgi:hypothetical protein
MSDLSGRGFLLTFKPYPTIKFGELKNRLAQGILDFCFEKCAYKFVPKPCPSHQKNFKKS